MWSGCGVTKAKLGRTASIKWFGGWEQQSGCAFLKGSEKLATRNNASFLPFGWKVAQISGNQIVRVGGFGAFQEHVVVRIRTGVDAPAGLNNEPRSFQPLNDLLDVCVA